MLGEDVEPAGGGWIAVQRVGGDTGDGGLAFQHLEPVGGDQDGVGGFFQPVIGAA